MKNTTLRSTVIFVSRKIHFRYVSWLRILCRLLTVLTGVTFESLKLTASAIETIFTRTELKEHSIQIQRNQVITNLVNPAESYLQFIIDLIVVMMNDFGDAI